MQIFKNLLLHMHVDKNFVLVLFVFYQNMYLKIGIYKLNIQSIYCRV